MAGPGASVTTESPDKQRIPCRDKSNKSFRNFDQGKRKYSRTRQPK